MPLIGPALARIGATGCTTSMVAHLRLRGYVSARTINTIATMTATTATNHSSTRKASASDRSGFSNGANLEDVDRRVDDDPHGVDEVPVNARHFHPLMVLGRIVAAERTQRDDRQRAQADEHVGAV